MGTEPAQRTIVSPDVTGDRQLTINQDDPTKPLIVLQPMAEWKQAAQRGVRSAIQCAVFLLGGGTITVFVAQYGVAPDMIAALPTTGNKALDALAVSAAFGLLTFLWNWVEFWLDLDIHVPGWRA